ncbi:hypothetical protein JJL45_03665 [Tamlana sp. s12]|uniref:hypothetical protein n=1 Tax=Tamlana sp. s12 TaxID=1630406 RepID=UPI0008002742|nr:hypothetical protein [Tamlana sp. s12]OBQ54993.1 hypothetical protein VQ01_09635 [Tamlana sp. s12]QQY83103.1 hypothetical protein JJL45_03665 [Tamlana sp. s12]
MKKIIAITIVSLFYINSYSQEKWYSSAAIEFSVPSKIEYHYNFNNSSTVINLDSKTALGAQYSINYLVFNKLSVGALTGIQNQFGADFFAFRIGGNLKYYFVDDDNVYAYLRYARNFTVDKDKFKNGDNLRGGIGFPFLKTDDFNLNLNVFYDINYFNLEDAEPLIFGNERSKNIFFRSFGISVGIKF